MFHRTIHTKIHKRAYGPITKEYHKAKHKPSFKSITGVNILPWTDFTGFPDQLRNYWLLKMVSSPWSSLEIANLFLL